MKKSVITSVLAVLAALTTTVGAQNYPKEYLGLPGDNLNLYAVMDLFRNAPTLEAFERSLNEKNSRINNLDLNGDWRVDYIAVSDYRDGRVHNIVLRAVLGRNEYQDVAVITVQKLKKRKVYIQIIGDELLYGRNYIVEPVYTKKHKIRYSDSPVYYYGGATIYNNYYDIWDWPVVIHIYSPYYDGWSSSWYWGYYPTWYEPWSPWYWDYYYGYHSGWHSHYHSWYHHHDRYRYHRYNDYYYHSVRQASPTVQRRVAEGTYRQTYSRPEQRVEGAEFQRRTHAAVTEGTRSQVTGTRRQATPQAAGSTSTDATRRQATPRAASGNTTDGTRRSAAGTEGRSSTESGTVRRNSEGTVSRDAADAARRTPSTVSRTEQNSERTGQAGESVRRTAVPAGAAVKNAESEAAEARAAQERAAQERASQEQRVAEQRANEQRAAEARAAQERASEQRAAEAREAERRNSEIRAAQERASEQRAAEQRVAEQRASEQRAAEARESERRAAESRAAQGRTQESGLERTTRR